MRVLIPVRDLITTLEGAGLLSKYEPEEVVAFAALILPLVQVGLDRLRLAWNAVRRPPQPIPAHPERI